MTREKRKHAIKCLKSECEMADFSFGCKKKCETDGADCYIKIAIKSLQAWDEALAELERAKKSIIGKYDSTVPILENPSHKIAFNNGLEKAIEIIKQKLGEQDIGQNEYQE